MSKLVVSSIDPLIAHLGLRAKDKAFTARKRLSAKIANVHLVLNSLIKESGELQRLHREITEIQTRIRLLQRGVPATEAFDDPDPCDNLTDAERFVLKKAYRKAASLCHPDRGGSNDEFQAVHAAYLAGDLYSLNNFVLSKQEPDLSWIQHWIDDAARCDVAWVEFQASAEFYLARLHEQGQTGKAVLLYRQALHQVLNNFQQEEYQLLMPKIPTEEGCQV